MTPFAVETLPDAFRRIDTGRIGALADRGGSELALARQAANCDRLSYENVTLVCRSGTPLPHGRGSVCEFSSSR
jgi:hypothetical protein